MTTKRTRQCPGTEEEEDAVPKKTARKLYRCQCSTDGCTSTAYQGGVCKRHGAKIKRCNSKGCTNQIVKGGVCHRHVEQSVNELRSRDAAAAENDAQIKFDRKECACGISLELQLQVQVTYFIALLL